MKNLITRYLIPLVAVISILQAGKIIHMNGSYDLDFDGLMEFITLETENSVYPNFIRYYEIDEDGFQQLTWELSASQSINDSLEYENSGSFAGVDIGDINGDGNPEVITILNSNSSGTQGLMQPVVYIYEWTQEGFNEFPTYSLDLVTNTTFLRCQNFALINIDKDDDQEIIATLGAPDRSTVIMNINAENILEITHRFNPEKLKSGIGFHYVVPLDYDWDGDDDFIIYSPEGSVLRAVQYYNENGVFIPGEGNSKIIKGMSGHLSLPGKTTDWDNDGFKDVLLPFRSGHLLALTMSSENLAIDEIVVDAGPLSDLNIVDINQDDMEDILLISGDLNLITLVFGSGKKDSLSFEYYTLEDEFHDFTQVFATLPLTEYGLYNGSVLVSGWDGSQNFIFKTDIGSFAPIDTVESVMLIDSVQAAHDYPEESDEYILIEDTDNPDILLSISASGQSLPTGILPRHILPVNQSFAYTIPEEEGRTFFSFRWLTPPPRGMYFHYETKSMRWIPDESDLGAYPIAYEVKMKIGERVIQEDTISPDSLSSYHVIPELEGYQENLWIYVNDPPVFVSEPQNTEFVANSRFVYDILVRDRNVDRDIYTSLENAPDGMVLKNDTLSWQTDSSHVDVYNVRIVTTDGFDRSAQEFQLFARAGVRILSDPPLEAKINQLFEYQVSIWHQDLDYPISFTMESGPAGMAIDDRGFLSWTPSSTQVDTQYFAVVASHGISTDTQRVAIFVNHPPIIVSQPPRVNTIKVGDIWDFDLQVIDPNQKDKMIFTALELPDGMRMDPFTGRLRWEPTLKNVDFSHLTIEISDGKDIRIIESEFFVNAAPKIVSIPIMLATVGEPYSYPIMISDRNTGSLLPFKKVIPVSNSDAISIYEVNISDDVARENIDRYIGDWNNRETVYLVDQSQDNPEVISRLNLKKYVHSIFFEDERLYVLLETIDERNVKIKDVLWEFFQGNQGKPPKVIVTRRGTNRFSLLDFPFGMTINELTGTIEWTPVKEQVDVQTVTVLVSDGYAKDEQTYEIYTNHVPTIISSAAATGQVDKPYKYSLQVEDLNTNADLEYELVKGPAGMQIDRDGNIAWIPRSSQINTHIFEVKVSDGYREDRQENKVFINMSPSIISIPRPVTLTNHLYKYRIVAEDLNQDKISFRSVRLPKYSKFNAKTGEFSWKPKGNQTGPNDIIILAIDEHGATTSHEIQIHVFEDPSARQFVNTGWPLMLTFVGILFAWGLSQL